MTETAAQRVVALIREGRKIEAVNAVREQTGVGLKDALRAVDALEKDQQPEAVEASGDAVEEARALVAEGRPVEAIRVLRQRSGLGLKEAKDVVDAMPAGPESPPPVSRARALAVLVLALVVLAVVLALLLR